MNWFKINVNNGTDRGYNYAGSSPDSIETLVAKAARGEFIRLDDLIYYDRGDAKDWSTWDNRDMPMVYIKGDAIWSIQQFKADPRTLTK